MPNSSGFNDPSACSKIDEGLLQHVPRIIADSSAVIEDMQSFMKQAESHVWPILPQQLKLWRAKRRDNKLSALYTGLSPRVSAFETTLRHLIDMIAEEKSDVKGKAKIMRQKVEKCGKYTFNSLSTIIQPVQESRELINTLTDSLSTVKCMVEFNTEVILLRAEQINRDDNNCRVNFSENSKTEYVTDLESDQDHSFLSHRLMELRELRTKNVNKLQNMLEIKEMYSNDVERLNEAYSALSVIIRAPNNQIDYSNSNSSSSSSSSSDSNVDKSYATNDDSQVIYTAAKQCIDYFNMLTENTLTCSNQLETLIELREKAKALFDQIEHENSNESSNHSDDNIDNDSDANSPRKQVNTTFK